MSLPPRSEPFRVLNDTVRFNLSVFGHTPFKKTALTWQALIQLGVVRWIIDHTLLGDAFLIMSAFDAFIFGMVNGHGWICIALVNFAIRQSGNALFGALQLGMFDALLARSQTEAGALFLPQILLMMAFMPLNIALVIVVRRSDYRRHPLPHVSRPQARRPAAASRALCGLFFREQGSGDPARQFSLVPTRRRQSALAPHVPQIGTVPRAERTGGAQYGTAEERARPCLIIRRRKNLCEMLAALAG